MAVPRGELVLMAREEFPERLKAHWNQRSRRVQIEQRINQLSIPALRTFFNCDSAVRFRHVGSRPNGPERKVAIARIRDFRSNTENGNPLLLLTIPGSCNHLAFRVFHSASWRRKGHLLPGQPEDCGTMKLLTRCGKAEQTEQGLIRMLRQEGSASQKKYKEGQRTLEREVLNALRVRKQPVKWDVLCAHFDRQSPVYHIASVLKELKDGHLIAVDGKQNVTITDVGLMRLAAGMF